MVLSELVKMALHELNISKVKFAQAVGISTTTLYRILEGESLIPPTNILEYLKKENIEIYELDYNDIYYEYIFQHYGNEYQWIDDIQNGCVSLKHNSCGKVSLVPLDLITGKDILCLSCWIEKYGTATVKYDYEIVQNMETGKIELTHNDCQLSHFVRYKSFKKRVKKNEIVCPYCTSKPITDSDKLWCEKFDFKFNPLERTYTIKKYVAYSKRIILPKNFNNCPVTRVDRGAFYKDEDIESVIIPEGYIEIGEKAFYGCTNLKTIKIPTSCSKIDETAFDNCASLKLN